VRDGGGCLTVEVKYKMEMVRRKGRYSVAACIETEGLKGEGTIVTVSYVRF
jgi:hypothetical protein